ncbi:TlpA family protein disulfide reductase [Terriglobus aquaticus]|uniref:TlpA family protein disulfide reductase n=1 Tax=Terriglobus aquaticus TaxID=940139 RepID=UPI0021DF6458|nr:TlpA family protein disulfide reductase [Terriglobus aquaticus]
MRFPALLLLSASVALAAAAPEKPAFESDPAFQKQKAQAQALERQRGNVLFAADAWRKANKIAGNQCMECYEHAIRAYADLGDTKDAVKEAAAMEAAAVTPADKSDAEMQQGRALLFGAGDEKFKPAMLEQAHAALSKAYSTDPTNRPAAFLDGMALARLDRNAEASTAFRAFAEHAPESSAMRLRAKHFAENPELARHKSAPPVVVTTLAGKKFNLDDMHGRVVLVDFWATWCGPCNQELPHMQKLAKKYENDPFEVISISWDSDETKWKDFIAAHNMTWNQYRDTAHTLSTAFHVDAIPHYFTIDSDGVLTAETVGSGSMADSRIDKLVQRAREAQRERGTAMAVAQPAATQ